MILLFVASGCGPKLPAATDAEKQEARKALLTALDAWQAGKTHELKKQTPPITFTDDDVVQGHALVSYDLDPAMEIKPQTDVRVNLIVRDRAGQTQHRSATYQVTLTPTPSVLRNDP